MYYQLDSLKDESDRLCNLVGRLYNVQDELKNIEIRLSEDTRMQFCIPEINRILINIDLECERLRRTARCLLYIVELCSRCNRRVNEILEEDVSYYVESYDWVENQVDKDIRLSIEKEEV